MMTSIQKQPLSPTVCVVLQHLASPLLLLLLADSIDEDNNQGLDATWTGADLV